MICDKCGKSNLKEAVRCEHCGAEMPKKVDCGGFADILSFKETMAQPEGGADMQQGGVNSKDMQILMKKSDNIMKTSRKNAMFGFLSVALCIVILISSIVMNVITAKKLDAYQKDMDAVKEALGIVEQRRKARR